VHRMKPDPAPRPGASRGRIGPTFTRAGLEGRQGLEPGAHRQGFEVHRVKPDRRQGQGQGPAVAGSAGPSPAWAWKVTRALSPAPWVEPCASWRRSAGLRGAPGEAGPGAKARARGQPWQDRPGLEGRQGLEPGAHRQGFEVREVEPDPAPRFPGNGTQGASRGRIGRAFIRSGLEGRQGLEPGAHRQGFEVHRVKPDPAPRPGASRGRIGRAFTRAGPEGDQGLESGALGGAGRVSAPIGRGFEVHQVEPDPAPRPGPGASRGRIGRAFTRAGLEGRQGLEPGALGGAGRVPAPIGRRFDVHRMKPDRRQGQGQGRAVAGSAGPSPARAGKVTRALSPAPWVEQCGCRRPAAGASRFATWSRTRRQGRGSAVAGSAGPSPARAWKVARALSPAPIGRASRCTRWSRTRQDRPDLHPLGLGRSPGP